MMRTLVLNAGYEPLGVISDRRALVLVLNGRASVLDEDEDAPVRTATSAWGRPRVILLQRYVRVPSSRVQPVSRRGVLRRDANRCAYCDGFANTIDHVMPRSRGGADSWENLVACCLRCNNAKGDRTPQEMGWRLRWEPKTPRPQTIVVRWVEEELPVWRRYLPAGAVTPMEAEAVAA